MMKFKELNLSPEMLKAVADMGFEEMSKIQEYFYTIGKFSKLLNVFQIFKFISNFCQLKKYFSK